MGPTELPVVERPEPPGYIAGVLGCLLGAGLGLMIGVWLGSAYSDRFMPNAELEALGPIIVGEALGIWLGGAIGVFIALKIARRRSAAPTAALVAAAIPAWAIVSLPSLFWLLQTMSGDDVPGVLQVVLPVIVLVAPPPLASRWLVLHNEKVRAQKDREESSG
jgi:hypothetical protein